MGIPIFVQWTNYSTIRYGHCVKDVCCENCSTDFVYIIEREGFGYGTSVYGIGADEAERHSLNTAGDSLRESLANDFDAVPCPQCGHYQRSMFPKLIETKTLLGPLARILAFGFGIFGFVAGVFWTIRCIENPNVQSFRTMIIMWSCVVGISLVAYGLMRLEQRRIQKFDPNLEDVHVRIERGKQRAILKKEYLDILRLEEEAKKEQSSVPAQEQPR